VGGVVELVAPAVRREPRAVLRALQPESVVPFGGALLAVGGLGAANGGYFPAAWGWPTLAFGWAAAIALLVRGGFSLGRLEIAFAGALTALTGWQLLSLFWAADSTWPVYEAERALVYAAGVAAALLVVRGRTVTLLLAGVLGGIACVDVYGLGTRLLPDRLGRFEPVAPYRLAAPIGYWNGLGIFSTIGIILALGFAARGRSTAARVLGAMLLPPLLVTLYFTFGRGAWIALGVGVFVAILLDPRRLQLVTVAGPVLVPGGIVVWLASRSDTLTTQGASLAAAARDGHRIALAIALAVAGSGVLALVLAVLGSRISVPRKWRLAYASGLCTLVVAACVGALVHLGGPSSAARETWHSFTAPPVRVTAGTRLESRLFSLSSNGRIDLWRAAWADSRAHPWLGGGAGSYEPWWLAHRPSRADVRDAHSLYLETLAEVGPIGLTLLVLALALPLAGAVKARRQRLVPLAAGAYVAYVVHAAADWDWELTAVTLAALLCGAAVLAAGRRERARALPMPTRVCALACAAAVIATSFLVLLGNVPLGAAARAADAGNWRQSAREARRAARWAPWSAEPWRLRGEAELAVREPVAARRDLRVAIAKDPENWLLWYDLAAASDGRRAAQALERARELNPHSKDVAEGL
jgi:hypothetical protein